MSDTMDEAFRPMPPPPTLAPPTVDQSQFVIRPEARQPTIDPKTGLPKRGRGRPPGSKNRPKTPDGGVNPPMTVRVPGGPRTQTGGPVDEATNKKEEKKAKAEKYSQWITQELNDKLFMTLIGMSNGAIKPEHIYKSGFVPPKVQGNPNLTDMGNAIAIPADVADSWGKLIAEVTATEGGGKVEKMAENHVLMIIIAAGSALFSTYRYTQQLKPYIAMIKAVQDAQAKAAQEQDSSGNGGG